MSNKLYVGNLSYGATEDSLKSVFSEHGSVVSVKIVVDRETNRSRGFGFIEMKSAEDAQSCIDALDGQEVDGRAIKINIAKERTDSRGGGGKRW